MSMNREGCMDVGGFEPSAVGDEAAQLFVLAVSPVSSILPSVDASVVRALSPVLVETSWFVEAAQLSGLTESPVSRQSMHRS
jgi:hypothetical protein